MMPEEVFCYAGDNTRLCYHKWRAKIYPRAAIIILHGLFEHGGRYELLAGHFSERGYTVYAPDLRGHGLSQGRRVWARSFGDYISDLEELVRHVCRELNNLPLFLLGHCLGSLIALDYAVKHQVELSGLITSGAFLKPGVAFSPKTAASAYVLGNLPLLSSRIGVPLFKESGISRSQSVARKYLEDRLVFHGNVSARLGLLILRQMRNLPPWLGNLRLPLLALHGTADLISDNAGSRALVEKAASADKTLKLYNGFYHDIFNDTGYEQVYADLDEWLSAHIVLRGCGGNSVKSKIPLTDKLP